MFQYSFNVSYQAFNVLTCWDDVQIRASRTELGHPHNIVMFCSLLGSFKHEIDLQTSDVQSKKLFIHLDIRNARNQ